MSQVMLIGKYEYVYGAGNTPNRAIEFFGNGQGVYGTVFAKVKGSWQKIGDVAETNMTKEGASTTEKMRLMMQAREEFKSPEYPPEKSFDKISYQEKVEVIKSLEPEGKYRITITNNIGLNPFFETVENLTFFDPS